MFTDHGVVYCTSSFKSSAFSFMASFPKPAEFLKWKKDKHPVAS